MILFEDKIEYKHEIKIKPVTLLYVQALQTFFISI